MFRTVQLMLEFTAPHGKCTAIKYNNGSIGFGMLLKLASIHVDSEEKAAPDGTDPNSLTALVFACGLFLPVCISQT